MGHGRDPARYPPYVRENRFKIGWLVVSIPTIVVIDVEGIAVAGLIAAVAGWAASHWLAAR